MVKKLMESIREQKKNSILAMVTISGEVVFEVIIPLLMANLIDYGIDMGDMGYIVNAVIDEIRHQKRDDDLEDDLTADGDHGQYGILFLFADAFHQFFNHLHRSFLSFAAFRQRQHLHLFLRAVNK